MIVNLMSDRSFRCSRCGLWFAKGQTEEEAMAEYRANFKDFPKDQRALVCDDCYPIIVKFIGELRT
jgi:rubredoxin